jgi:protein-S-isoprenylcysteine O-methyltransferase Ste14
MPSWARIATRLRVPLAFAFAAAYLCFAHPSWTWVTAGSVFIAAGLAVRAAASGHIRKNRELTTTGPYAYTRNPLYVGSILIAMGFVLAARTPWLGVAACVMFVAVYLPVVRGEEQYLRTAFPEFDQYVSQVPRFFPRWTPYRTGVSGIGSGYSRDLYLKHREYNAALGSILMIGVLILKMMLVRH